MSFFLSRILAVLMLLTTLACGAAYHTSAAMASIPDPVIDAPLANSKGEQTAVIAGGCFWGVEAVFEHVKGVRSVTAGYSGGSADAAHYETVSAGKTGHAESVQITYDPSQITYGQLLKVFFSVAHNPMELNRQGPDTGAHYRSAIFFSDEDQGRIARAYVDQLNQAQAFKRQIVTQVVALNSFYKAEDYHQDYASRHPDQPYIVIHDLPKVANLQKQFPNLYTQK